MICYTLYYFFYVKLIIYVCPSMVYIGNLRLQTNRSVHQEDLEILLMGSIFAWQHYFEVFEFCPSAWILKQLTNLTNAMGEDVFGKTIRRIGKDGVIVMSLGGGFQVFFFT